MYHPPMEPSASDGAHTRASRWSAVLDLLATRGRLSVAEAAAQLDVSEATVRRDFTELSRRQLVTRNHGGVVAAQVAYELPYRYRSSQADGELARIAQACAALVVPGQVVALNGGTTTTAVARAITSREQVADGGSSDITLVTNALNIASEAVLRPHVQCVSLGGVARPAPYEVTGPPAAIVVGQLWFDVAIVGVNAFAVDSGPMCRHEDEAAIVRAIVERSDKVVVAAAGAKLGQHSFASICRVDQVSMLVTTAAEDHAEVLELRTRGVDVRCV